MLRDRGMGDKPEQGKNEGKTERHCAVWQPPDHKRGG